jgi:hypothetical protein
MRPTVSGVTTTYLILAGQLDSGRVGKTGSSTPLRWTDAKVP